ncbi:hypothetical protein FRACYDRAFT_245007 [Fragilariopsis cylindrus CCMP1102]|uniref:Uncharacterized protein n=1 Tax=Fragilariopsis cylindrus CCMP1102 TaxID=635003 RepID=A0A1E7F187_9STRA|nr:hypothetical protein FRACYDRAFT_245007 [Fragilariopsis cylindrus CCMP1102]|eukprot:OEU11887.1 hypothetical protein FRACYDRAFT_245007 [Fragilariopsis cylindrus CCMP1102]
MKENHQESDPSKAPSIGSSKASITYSLSNPPIRTTRSSFPLQCPSLHHFRIPFQPISSSYQQPRHGFIPYRPFPPPHPYQHQLLYRNHYSPASVPAPVQFYPQPTWPQSYNYPFQLLSPQPPQCQHHHGSNSDRDRTPANSLSTHSTKMRDFIEFSHCLELSVIWKDKRAPTPYFELFTKKYTKGERGWLIDLLKYSDTSLLDCHDLFVRFAPFGSMYVEVVQLFYHAFDMDEKSVRDAKMKQQKLDAQQPKESVSFTQHHCPERTPVDGISLLSCRSTESAVKASSEKENEHPDSCSSSSPAVTFSISPPEKRKECEDDDSTRTVLKASTILKKQEATTRPKKRRRMNVDDLLDIMQFGANCIKNV